MAYNNTKIFSVISTLFKGLQVGRCQNMCRKRFVYFLKRLKDVASVKAAILTCCGDAL